MDEVNTHDLERIVGRVALGDESIVDGLRAVCTLVEKRGVSCGIARVDGDLVAGGERAERARVLVVSTGRLLAPGRAFHTRNDHRWAEILGDSASEATWIAREPIEAANGTSGDALVVLGETNAEWEALLPVLPRLGKTCGAILSRDHDAARYARITHVMNNLLASMIITSSYAYSLLAEHPAGADAFALLSEAEREDVLESLRHTTDASKQLATQVSELTSAAKLRERS